MLTTRRAAVLGAIAAAALMAATPAGASRTGCAATANGHRVVAESTRGTVFDRSGRLFACSYADGSVHVLPAQGRQRMAVGDRDESGISKVQREWVRMEGRYVAYGVHWTSTDERGGGAAGPPQRARVIVLDIRTGAQKYASGPSDAVDPFVDALVLKRDGSVAWMYEAGAGAIEPYHLVVKMDRSTGGAERGLDGDSGHFHGYDIEQGSLALSTDARHLYWMATLAGDPKVHHLTARLR